VAKTKEIDSKKVEEVERKNNERKTAILLLKEYFKKDGYKTI